MLSDSSYVEAFHIPVVRTFTYTSLSGVDVEFSPCTFSPSAFGSTSAYAMHNHSDKGTPRSQSRSDPQSHQSCSWACARPMSLVIRIQIRRTVIRSKRTLPVEVVASNDGTPPTDTLCESRTLIKELLPRGCHDHALCVDDIVPWSGDISVHEKLHRLSSIFCRGGTLPTGL